MPNKTHQQQQCIVQNGKFFREIEPNAWDVDARLKDMERDGIDVQVLCTVRGPPPFPCVYTVSLFNVTHNYGENEFEQQIYHNYQFFTSLLRLLSIIITVSRRLSGVP